MYKNLKIQERLKKCFTVVTLLASIAGVIGAIMMLIISTQYKHSRFQPVNSPSNIFSV